MLLVETLPRDRKNQIGGSVWPQSVRILHEKPVLVFHWLAACTQEFACTLESKQEVCTLKVWSDAPGLSGGGSGWLLDMNSNQLLDATTLRGGVSRFLATAFRLAGVARAL